jgi:hypothetical protein
MYYFLNKVDITKHCTTDIIFPHISDTYDYTLLLKLVIYTYICAVEIFRLHLEAAKIKNF